MAARANPTTGKLSDQDLIDIKSKIKGYIETNMPKKANTQQEKINEVYKDLKNKRSKN